MAGGRQRPAVRRAEPDELALLPELDRLAEAPFRALGLELAAIPIRVADLRAAGAVYVTGRPPIGFAELGELDGCGHLRQLSVLPEHARRGVGTALLERGAAWARRAGYPALLLTTFADVPWNGPFYAARGFVELAELPPGLAAARAAERALGLDGAGRRIAMRREL